ncbi:helix-turn-helix transcriptional regulator [Mycobacterium sp. E3251]|uniref:helix-turn-helix domain-containing protein n=1 Tax=Mycobacterium sp. E3251 TaxID=1834144 RepID=UPI0012E80E2F|nr:helix-turn-helix transcriptional regulator [Mycobacterium sp. E3251]
MPQNWEPRDWSEEQAHRVSEEVRRLRGTRSAQWLANRTAELGYHVSRSVIADLENGRRRYVTTAELVILARALDTAPIMLLYPPPYDEFIDARPEESRPKLVAIQGFSGEVGDDYSTEYLDNVEPLRRARQIDELEWRRRRLLGDLDSSPARSDTQYAMQLQSQLDWVTKQLSQLKGEDGG